MRSLKALTSTVLCTLGLSAISSSLAAEPLYTTTANQAGSPGTSWAGATYWKLNGTGTGVAPTAGNTYEVQFNGTTYGNGTGIAVIRPPYSAGTPSVVTFPGDCLILDTNTCFRFKEPTAPTAGPNGLGYASPTNNFPGANGLPGLVLNGGILNAGTTPSCYTIQGTMQAAPGALSYLNPADTLNGNLAKRGFVIASQLSGSGSLAWINATSAVPQVVSGTSNTFSGTWIVKSGWVIGNGNGTGDGYNSLGTNTAVVFNIDPQWTPPPIFNANAVWTPGPAILDMGAENANCGGTLILTNGGRLNLHSTVAFGSVIIEGTALANGTYLYSQLASTYPNNFPAGGSGGIVVRPYNPAPPYLPPTIVTQPLPQKVYAGATVTFSVSATANGAPSISYQWQKAGANLADGGNISGSTSATLTVSNVSAADAGNYAVVVASAAGPVTSAAVPLMIVTPNGESYEAAVLAARPAVFYRLNETGNPATNNSPAFDYAGGFVGTYGSAVQNGNALYNVAGPSGLNGFSGFSAGNAAAQFFGTQGSRISLPPWNINTNTMTFTAWVNPSSAQVNSAGLLFVRNGTGAAVAGLSYTGNTDASGNQTLGYNWNDEPNTYNWNSGLTTPPGQWSLVALVVTPTNATMYVINAGGALASVHPYNHIVKAFTVPSQIGEDSFDGGNGNRAFNGVMDDVAVFASALSPSQIMGLYTAAAPGATFQPAIAVQPVSTNLYQGQTAQFTALAAGSQPLTYQWQVGATGSGVYANITDGGQFSGATTPTLTIRGLDMPNAADYIVVVKNAYGTISSAVATLTVQATNSPQPGTITMAAQEGGVDDWNSGTYWSDYNPASVSAVAYPGSVYEILPGARMRTPATADVTSTFPGNTLLLDGDGVWVNSPGAGATIGEIRFKQPTYGSVNGTVIFPRLVMNGGQLDVGNDGTVVVGGRIDVLTNAPFYNDGGNDRGYQINAFLTGSASIEYHGYNQTAFMPAYKNCLNIACPTNTYSGTWNVVIGTLLGSAPNSLGTNSIIVGANGALETTYDIGSPKATLVLNGRMFLHQNDVFGSVAVAGTPLQPGTYQFADLAAMFPTNFPATWTAKTGAGNFSTGSGSITVLGLVAPTITVQPLASQDLFAQQTARFAATVVGSQPLYYQWKVAPLYSGGPYVNVGNGGVYAGGNSATFTISPVDLNNAGDYILVVTNLVGAATSTVARLTVQATYGPAEQLTLSSKEAMGEDWDTLGRWSDGNAASNSAVWYPGTTYTLLPGSMLRTPGGSATTYTFPGLVLTNLGNGIFNDPTNAEFRFKQAASGGAVVVPRLVMAGGQVDLGNGGLAVLRGQVDVVSNAIFFVDSGGGGGRSLQLDSFLTGSANIEWHSFDATLGDDLNVTCPTNTYTGTWNAVQGVLLGTGTNSLGTNNITVGANAALETCYDIYSPKAALTLNGKMYLHQNDTFRTMFCSGWIAPAPGTYTFAQLAAMYPANFPAAWAPVSGSTNSSASGSITLLSAVAPFVVQDLAPQVLGFKDATVTLAPVIGGSSPVSFQWQLNGANIADATNMTLVLSNAQVSSSGTYQLKVSNPAGSTNTIACHLSVYGAPQFTWYAPTPITTATATLAQPGTLVGAAAWNNLTNVNTVTTAGGSITFQLDGSVATVNGNGTGNGDFIGYVPSTGDASFDAVLNGYSYDGGPKTITLKGLTYDHFYSVQLFALDNRTAYADRYAYFQDPNYPANVSESFVMMGNNYVIGTFIASGTNQQIKMQLPNGNNGNLSSLVIRELSRAPQFAGSIVVSPAASVLAGTPVTLSSPALLGVGPFQYQWRQGGQPITGATSSTLVLTAPASGSYDVVVTSSAGTATATAVALSVNQGAPAFVQQPPAALFSYPNGAVVMSAVVNGSQPMSLQWMRDGQPVAGATSASLTLNSVQAANAGAYTLTATNSFGGTVSSVCQLSVVSSTQFSSIPLALAAGSLNQDVVVEKTASHPVVTTNTTASMDAGTGNTGNSFYAKGFNRNGPDTGMPAAGSTFISGMDPSTTFRMAASYTANNALLIDSAHPSGSLAVPTAPGGYCYGLALLTASTYGATNLGCVVQSSDGVNTTNTFDSPDWFNASAPAAYTNNGCVSVTGFGLGSLNGGIVKLYQTNITVFSSAPITNILFTWSTNNPNAHTAIFAVSASTDYSSYTPLTVTGFNQDMVVEASASAAQPIVGATTATFDAGVANAANTLYEQGYNTSAPATGLPAAGSVLTNAAGDHAYVLPASYTGANAALIDATHSSTLVLASPAAHNTLSFLTSAGNGPVGVNYTLHFKDGSSESGQFSSLDWFAAGTPVYTAAGRVFVDNGTFNGVNTANAKLWAADVVVTNAGTPITSIDLSYASGGRAYVFALSGGTAPAPVTAPTANPDVASTFWNVPVTIAALANDSDPSGSPLSIASVSTTNGTAAIGQQTNVVFTPAQGFVGTVSLAYTITNGNGGTASSWITVTVSAPPKLGVSSITRSGANLVLAGTNGAPNGTYTVLTSTNVALQLKDWTPVQTGTFNGSGGFNATVPVDSGTPRSFFLIKQ